MCESLSACNFVAQAVDLLFAGNGLKVEMKFIQTFQLQAYGDVRYNRYKSHCLTFNKWLNFLKYTRKAPSCA